jgi:hypothetical protein
VIIDHEPSSIYHGKPAPAVGSHALFDSDREAGGSLRHYYEKHVVPTEVEKEGDAFKFGRAFHAVVGEKRNLLAGTDAEFVIRPATYRNQKGEVKAWNAQAKECEKWANSETRTVIRHEDAMLIERMAREIRDDHDASEIMRDGKPEVVIRHLDQESGLQVQCRFDWIDLPRMVWADFKTCDDLAWLEKDAIRYNYHRQVAWYTRLLCDEMEWPFPNPDLKGGFIVASSKSMPWACQVFDFTPETLIACDKKNRAALNRLGQAYAENFWPQSTGGIRTITAYAPAHTR